MTIEITCLGHIITITDYCANCKKELRNNECPKYRPILYDHYKVSDELQIRPEDINRYSNEIDMEKDNA